MEAYAKPHMTVDQFLAWAEDKTGRFELHSGEIYAMAPERLGHASAKFAIQSALLRAIRKTGHDCYMVPDGVGVPVDGRTSPKDDLPGGIDQSRSPGIVIGFEDCFEA